MTSPRERDKRGLHVSVAGDPADETLAALVAQFSDPYAFIRELIQNSLDAGAQRIRVEMLLEGGQLSVCAIDDGEGMDRATIEGYLLTLFRSTKEEDLTKIGKFGIGFVSLFAIGPKRVIVDTGRDAIWHRVIFAEDRSYTLVRMPDPWEGTTVRLELPRTREQARTDCERIRASAVRWCGFAEAEITTLAQGVGADWDETPIARPFTVDAPVVITHTEDGLQAVLGPSRKPAVGFYNQGLTLWEEELSLVEGVSFRVKGRHLEHTLTRDNVIRNRHFTRVMERLHSLAAEQLGAALHEALEAASLDRTREIFASLSHSHPWRWRPDAPLFPKAAGGKASLTDLKGQGKGWWSALWEQKRTLLWAPPGDPVAASAEANGHLVLAADSEQDAHLCFAAELVGASVVSVHDHLRIPLSVELPQEGTHAFARANVLSQKLGLRFVLHSAKNLGVGRLALRRREPFAIEILQKGTPEEGDHLLVDVEHPVWRALSGLPPELCAPLLLRAALVGAGVQTGPVSRALLSGLPEESQ